MIELPDRLSHDQVELSMICKEMKKRTRGKEFQAREKAFVMRRERESFSAASAVLI